MEDKMVKQRKRLELYFEISNARDTSKVMVWEGSKAFSIIIHRNKQRHKVRMKIEAEVQQCGCKHEKLSQQSCCYLRMLIINYSF